MDGESFSLGEKGFSEGKRYLRTFPPAIDDRRRSEFFLHLRRERAARLDRPIVFDLRSIVRILRWETLHRQNWKHKRYVNNHRTGKIGSISAT
jgi:hypothetical protein